MCVGPRQGIFRFAEANASVLVKELSLAYYDMFAVVSTPLRLCVCVCAANGVNPGHGAHLSLRRKSVLYK